MGRCRERKRGVFSRSFGHARVPIIIIHNHRIGTSSRSGVPVKKMIADVLIEILMLLLLLLPAEIS